MSPRAPGHAHTRDVEGRLRYGVMADDTVAYLGRVVGGPALLEGWSDGAVVGLLPPPPWSRRATAWFLAGARPAVDWTAAVSGR